VIALCVDVGASCEELVDNVDSTAVRRQVEIGQAILRWRSGGAAALGRDGWQLWSIGPQWGGQAGHGTCVATWSKNGAFQVLAQLARWEVTSRRSGRWQRTRLASMSAPFCRSRSTTAGWLFCTATCSGVKPCVIDRPIVGNLVECGGGTACGAGSCACACACVWADGEGAR
jgi:hypothetical protein